MASKVSDHVFIGGYRTRSPPDIDHVLCLLTQWEYDTFDLAPVPAERETHLILDDSHAEQDLDGIIQRGVAKIEECVSRGEKILVHCLAGKSRSATVVLAWMMKSKELAFEEALTELRKAHPLASPNTTFVKYLKSLTSSLNK
jgi:protein-tyrosine phosphatase